MRKTPNIYLKKINNLSSLWYNFEMKDSLFNILKFILALLLYPFVWLYVKVNNIIFRVFEWKIKGKL